MSLHANSAGYGTKIGAICCTNFVNDAGSGSITYTANSITFSLARNSTILGNMLLPALSNRYIKYTYTLTPTSGSGSQSAYGPHLVLNAYPTYPPVGSPTNCLYPELQWTGTQFVLNCVEISGGTAYQSANYTVSTSTPYYITCIYDRAAATFGTFTMQIRTGSQSGTLVSTFTLTLHSSFKDYITLNSAVGTFASGSSNVAGVITDLILYM